MATRARVAQMRAFNRFYTEVIGVLQEGLLDTPYSLTEARVIFELAQRETTEVSDLRRDLRLDAGYLSRILGRLRADGLVIQETSAGDRRRQVVRLTPQGRAVFATLDQRSAEEVAALLATLAEDAQRRLVAAMGAIRSLLDGGAGRSGVMVRPPQAGDLGWVIERHGAVYHAEYGWNSEFEALVAGIVAAFANENDPGWERAWIATVDGERAGCVFCVRGEQDVARLRLLLVEPAYRGQGIGGRLVEACMAFAREAGYRRMTLWTNDVLVAARSIYERAGFALVASESHHSFGHDLVAQIFERDL